ncbi:MAG: hypothetical protein GXO42_03035 [bacterium]|nr:hypothetical protein [bacterium]
MKIIPDDIAGRIEQLEEKPALKVLRTEHPALPLLEEFLQELASLSVQLQEGELPAELQPVLRFLGIRNPIGYFCERLVFLGVPAALESQVLLADLELLARKQQPISLQLSGTIVVLSTSYCPYCPYMAVLAHKIAAGSPGIYGVVVSLQEYPEVAERLCLQAVPCTLVFKNGELVAEFYGIRPERLFLKELEEWLKK